MIETMFDFLFFPAKSADMVIHAQDELIVVLRKTLAKQKQVIDGQQIIINIMKEKQ